MEPDPTVKIALKILGSEARVDVESAIEDLAYVSQFSIRRSKKGKAAAERLARVLERLDLALRDECLFDGLKPNENLHPCLSPEGLARWIRHCEVTANRPLNPSHPKSDGKEWTGAYERRAAELALVLMRTYNKPVRTTKNSKFEKLAAALAGTPQANFHHYCRWAINSAK